MKAACATAMLLLSMLCAVSGCGTTMRFGRLPDASKLESALQPGLSTRADVLKVLGTPRCSGGAMLPTDHRPQDLWLYYYEEASLSDARRMFLFIFFDQDCYSGYMWFSSLPPSLNPAE